MRIDDLHFNAQAVNKNGKVEHFDSIECMLRHTDEHKKYVYRYVKNFFRKEQYVKAEDAYYLRSTQLASPMGAGLSAYLTEEEQEEARKKYTGEKLRYMDTLRIFAKMQEGRKAYH